MVLSKFLQKAALLALLSLPGVAPAINWDDTHVRSYDRLTVSELKSDETGSYFTIFLEGNSDDPDLRYSNYNFTIDFPEESGLTFQAADDEGSLDVFLPSEGMEEMYPMSKRNQPYHTVMGKIQNGGLRTIIAVYSVGYELLEGSGPLLDVYVTDSSATRAALSRAAGNVEVRFSNICLASLQGEGIGYYPDDHSAILYTQPLPTGIENIAVDTDDIPEIFFNLQGQPVEHPSHGLFFTSRGRKVLLP